jgi:hypothetical protein
MQTSHTSGSTMWKQVYEDALFEADPRLLRPKLEAAQKAVEYRLFELRSGSSSDQREQVELTEAQQTLLYLQDDGQQN